MTDINQHFKQSFGADFSRLKPEQLKAFDEVVAGASSPEIIYVNGQPQRNPKRLAFDRAVQEGGGVFTKDFAQKLGVYASWRARMVPQEGEGQISEHTRAQASRAGIPLEKLNQMDKERKEAWASSVLNRFAHMVPSDDDTAEKSENAMLKVDDKKTDTKPLDNPLTRSNPPPPVAIAAPGVQGVPSSAAMQMPPESIVSDPGMQMPDQMPTTPQQPVIGLTGPSEALPEMQKRPGVM